MLPILYRILPRPSSEQKKKYPEVLLQLVKKVRSDFLTRGGRMHPVGRDPCVPPQECDFPRRGDVGIASYERTGGRVCTLGVGDGVLPWSAAEQMPLGYNVPSARRCRYPVGRGLRAPPENMHIVRRDTWVPPYGAGAINRP